MIINKLPKAVFKELFVLNFVVISETLSLTLTPLLGTLIEARNRLKKLLVTIL